MDWATLRFFFIQLTLFYYIHEVLMLEGRRDYVIVQFVTFDP